MSLGNVSGRLPMTPEELHVAKQPATEEVASTVLAATSRRVPAPPDQQQHAPVELRPEGGGDLAAAQKQSQVMKLLGIVKSGVQHVGSGLKTGGGVVLQLFSEGRRATQKNESRKNFMETRLGKDLKLTGKVAIAPIVMIYDGIKKLREVPQERREIREISDLRNSLKSNLTVFVDVLGNNMIFRQRYSGIEQGIKDKSLTSQQAQEKLKELVPGSMTEQKREELNQIIDNIVKDIDDLDEKTEIDIHPPEIDIAFGVANTLLLPCYLVAGAAFGLIALARAAEGATTDIPEDIVKKWRPRPAQGEGVDGKV